MEDLSDKLTQRFPTIKEFFAFLDPKRNYFLTREDLIPGLKNMLCSASEKNIGDLVLRIIPAKKTKIFSYEFEEIMTPYLVKKIIKIGKGVVDG